MKDQITFSEARVLRLVILFSGGIAALTGFIVVILWMFGAENLTSVLPGYKPMSPSTGILSFVFGMMMLSGTCQLTTGLKKNAILLVVAVFSIYAFLVFLEYFLKADLTFDAYILPVRETIKGIPVSHSSPISGVLFFLTGVALLLKMYGKERIILINLIGSIALVILFAGFSGLVGYMNNTPFLYGGEITPLSFPTTFVLFLLGFGLMAMSGMNSIYLRSLSGDSGRARILRALLPTFAIVMIVDDLLDAALSHLPEINFIMISTAFAIIFLPISAWLIVKITKKVFLEAEKSEEARQIAEATLKESEERFRNLAESAHDAIIGVDSTGSIHVFNPAAERIFGYSAEEVLFKSIDSIVPDAYENDHRQAIIRFQETGHSTIIGLTRELLGKRKGGEVFPIEMSLSEVKLKGHSTFTGIIRDITERKKIESELEKFTQDLQESNATKDKFFSIIAHDLKSPFNSILGFANLLIRDHHTYDGKEIARMLSTIKMASEKAFELVENLLIWANSQTGRILYDPEKFSLHSTINETIAILEGQAARKEIRIVVVGDDHANVIADHQMVKTVLRNLISNAIKFTQKGGLVTISATRSEICWTVSVKDTGIGMATESIQNLFTIENKYSTPGTANETGSGLGLILCREFIEKHHGKIWVESEPGAGSTFYFTIPDQSF